MRQPHACASTRTKGVERDQPKRMQGTIKGSTDSECSTVSIKMVRSSVATRSSSRNDVSVKESILTSADPIVNRVHPYASRVEVMARSPRLTVTGGLVEQRHQDREREALPSPAASYTEVDPSSILLERNHVQYELICITMLANSTITSSRQTKLDPRAAIANRRQSRRT